MRGDQVRDIDARLVTIVRSIRELCEVVVEALDELRDMLDTARSEPQLLDVTAHLRESEDSP